jgi:soluble lytic murein transglycosylase
MPMRRVKLAVLPHARLFLTVAAVFGLAAGASLHAQSDSELQVAKAGLLVPAARASTAHADKPAAPKFVPTILSGPDHSFLVEAHRAADRNDWKTSRALADRSTHEAGRLTITWRYLLDDRSDPSFTEIVDFLDRHPNWPRSEALIRRAEALMPRTFSAEEVIAWYAARPPLSKDGKIRLGQALLDSGNEKDGTQLIATAWIENRFTEAGELNFLELYAGRLTAADHAARLERLIAENDLTDARRQLRRLDGTEKLVAEARLGLRRAPAKALKDRRALPPVVRDDPRYRFEYARALHRADRDEEAWQVMAQVTPETGVDPVMSWNVRHTMARQALQAQRPDLAYRIASNHSLPRQGAFAEAEFLSGWIALRALGNEDRALHHFRQMADAVETPISRARALYWVARSQEALQQPQLAREAYAAAAEYDATFYGQLALAKLEPERAVLRLTSENRSAPGGLQQDERLQALHALESLGQSKLVQSFALDLAEESADPASLKLIAEIVARTGDRRATLRVAKLAGRKNIILLPYTAPLLHLPTDATAAVEDALVLGLTRQESEFNPNAVSPAGASGLMQLMPATAAETARRFDIRYSPADIKEPNTNLRLGSAYLASLVSSWSGSYVLAIASYNAGPGNVRKWVRTIGDPRTGEIDPVDWIEAIPFAETRNYVQRVLENTQLYRNRLAGSEQKLMLMADLARASDRSRVSNSGPQIVQR